MGNGEWGMGNGEWRMGNGEWGVKYKRPRTAFRGGGNDQPPMTNGDDQPEQRLAPAATPGTSKGETPNRPHECGHYEPGSLVVTRFIGSDRMNTVTTNRG